METIYISGSFLSVAVSRRGPHMGR